MVRETDLNICCDSADSNRVTTSAIYAFCTFSFALTVHGIFFPPVSSVASHVRDLVLFLLCQISLPFGLRWTGSPRSLVSDVAGMRTTSVSTLSHIQWQIAVFFERIDELLFAWSYSVRSKVVAHGLRLVCT